MRAANPGERNVESHTSLPVKEHHVHQRHFDRLVMLSDGVFAIALTLSAVELKPEAHPGQTLAQVWGMPLLTYFLSFFIIGSVWLRHRRTLTHLRRVDNTLTLISLVLLALIALVPVMIRVMVTGEGGVSSTDGMVIYALSLIAIHVCLALGWAYAAFVGQLAPDVPRPRAWSWLLHDLFVVAVWGAIACFFLHLTVLVVMVALTAVAVRIGVVRFERLARQMPQ
jgi:uncharacterized membrane protein